MKIELPDTIDKRKWAAFLGIAADDLPVGKTDECQRLLLKAASPRGCHVIEDLPVIGSRSLERHLEDCSRVVIMGITLGRGVDDMLRHIQIGDMEMALYFDSGASILAEYAADMYEEEIRKGLPEETPYMTGRFSPGYGDLPLEYQKTMIRQLDAERRLGLTLNENDLMIPMKSITAIAGISDVPVTGHLAECSECLLYDECERRKEGHICGK